MRFSWCYSWILLGWYYDFKSKHSQCCTQCNWLLTWNGAFFIDIHSHHWDRHSWSKPLPLTAYWGSLSIPQHAGRDKTVLFSAYLGQLSMEYFEFRQLKVYAPQIKCSRAKMETRMNSKKTHVWHRMKNCTGKQQEINAYFTKLISRFGCFPEQVR